MRTAREWVVSVSAVLALAAAVAVAVLAFSGRFDRVSTKLPPPRKVVLYTSVDDPIARAVVERFRLDMQIIVELVGDTEATKTTGLVQRLLAEKESPRADVWWSSEPMGTILLAREGVLAPMESPPYNIETGEAWPEEFKSPDGTWHAFAQRARVIGYNSRWVRATTTPMTLRDVVDPEWKGRVGIARPQFGTTRTHMAALVAWHGPELFREWLEALHANEVRLYDGNATIVRAIAMGEIDLGLTDTDDVWSGMRNAWPVAMNYEIVDERVLRTRGGQESPGGALRRPASAGLPSVGSLTIPNTVSIVKGGPNPVQAKILAEYLLSERTEIMLAQSEQHTMPIRPWISHSREFSTYVIPSPAAVDWERVADAMPEAMRICEEVLGR